jgi:transcriptional regulator with XRE-family HTH domain
MDKPPQRPEGALIKQAIDASGLSLRKAAARVELSDARLRQIVNGYSSHGQGQYLEVIAPALRLAQIAHAFGITTGQLRDADRVDAAAELERLSSGSVSAPDQDVTEFEFLTRVREDLTTDEMEQLMREATPYLEMLVRDIRNRNRSAG